MKVLVIMHAESEGPGTLGEFLECRHVSIYTVRLYAGDRLPDERERFDAVVSMGGPMNVYEKIRTCFTMKAVWEKLTGGA
jgi:GMP synthase-like glutamine amidotransferase